MNNTTAFSTHSSVTQTVEKPVSPAIVTPKPVNQKPAKPKPLVQEHSSPAVIEVPNASAKPNGFRSQLLKTRIPLLISDLLACLVSLGAGALLASVFVSDAFSVLSPQLLGVTLGGLVALFVVLGLFSGLGMHPVYEFRQCVVGVAVCYGLVACQNLNAACLAVLLFAFPLTMVTVLLSRSILRHILSKSDWWGVNCLVFSADRRINRLYPVHIKNQPYGLRPVGFIQDEVPNGIKDSISPLWLGKLDETNQIMQQHGANVAVVHRRGRTDNELSAFHEQYLRGFNHVVIVPDDERIPTLWSLGKDGGLIIQDRLLQPSAQLIKRTMDVAVSGTVLILGLPLFAMIAVWMKVTSPGPLFFGHERIGQHGKRFKTWKFRSMCVNADEVLEKALAESPEMREEWAATQKLQNDPRVSSSGRFLRKTSLDEIPQLWNVLKGEMSLVGPRPIVENEIEKYEEKYKSYTRVIPGVTGFWQISGRNLTTYERRVELDEYYVRNWSIWFDLYILFRTVKTVLMREGAF